MGNGYDQSKFGEPVRKRRGAFIECEGCHRQFYVHPSRLKRAVNVRFCSQACYDKRGEKNPFWGKAHSAETVIKMIGSPVRSESGKKLAQFVRERAAGIIGIAKRRPMIEELGRCERCGFLDVRILQIHHKDRNRKNNVRQNLEVLCPNCHMLEHLEHSDGTYAHTGQGLTALACKRGHLYSDGSFEWNMTRNRPHRICRICNLMRRRQKRSA